MCQQGGQASKGWTRGSASAKTLGLEGGGLCDPTSIEEENEAFFIYKGVKTSP